MQPGGLLHKDVLNLVDCVGFLGGASSVCVTFCQHNACCWRLLVQSDPQIAVARILGHLAPMKCLGTHLQLAPVGCHLRSLQSCPYMAWHQWSMCPCDIPGYAGPVQLQCRDLPVSCRTHVSDSSKSKRRGQAWPGLLSHS